MGFDAAVITIFQGRPMLEMTTDPVCGMRIEAAETHGTSRFEGHTFRFCSELCKSRFDADPERYALGAGAPDTRP